MLGAVFYKGFVGIPLFIFNPQKNPRGSIIILEMEKPRPREFEQLPCSHIAPYCTSLWGPTEIMQVKGLCTLKHCTR